MPVLAVLFALPFLISLGCEELGTDEPIETRDDTFQVSGTVTLDVESFNGRITVTGSETSSVRVQATLTRADRADYSAEQFGNSVQVSASQNRSTTGRGPTANMTITAPASAILVLRTSNGSMEVRNFDAGGTLRTSNGRITVDGMSGDLEAITSNGAIEVTGHSGSVELETSNGPVRFDGELVAGSQNGMKTSNGSVTVALQGEPSLRLDTSTSNGAVSTAFQVVVTRSGEGYLEGTIGPGDAELSVRSSNGSITVR